MPAWLAAWLPGWHVLNQWAWPGLMTWVVHVHSQAWSVSAECDEAPVRVGMAQTRHPQPHQPLPYLVQHDQQCQLCR